MKRVKDNDVYWNGKLLGNIKELHLDNFNMYGDWSIINKELYSHIKGKFDIDEDVIIVIGSDDSAIKGIILDLSEDEIEFRYGTVIERYLL